MAIKDIIKDPVQFSKRLKIRLKDGKTDSLGNHILKEQIEIIDALHSNQRIAIIKSRQLGISTVIRAYAFHQAYTSNRFLNSAVISNKARSANSLLDIDRRFYSSLPAPLKQPYVTDKLSEISWKTGQIGAYSGSATDDRGFTLNFAHLSEFAYFDNAADTLASTIASVNDGKIVVESTPNFYGDHLHKIALDSMYNDSWKVMMVPWSIFPEYSKEMPKGTTLDKEEEFLMYKYALTKEQVFWRRCKIEEMKDIAKFKREYPLDLEEAYSLSDKNYFSTETLASISPIPIGSEVYTEFIGPGYAHKYVMGVDPAGGTGGDYSVARVMDVTTLETVAIYASNTVSISSFSETITKMASKYMKALIVFEENNHGAGIKQKLDSLGYFSYQPFLTTAKSKLQLYDTLRTYIEEDLLTSVDAITYQELRGLIKNDALAPVHASGAHDDRVISLALCLHGLKSVPKPLSNFDRLLQQGARVSSSPTMQKHPLRN